MITAEHGAVGGYEFNEFVIYYILALVMKSFSTTNVLYVMDWWVRLGLMTSYVIRPVSVRGLVFVNSVGKLVTMLMVRLPVYAFIIWITGAINGLREMNVETSLILTGYIIVFFLFSYMWEFLWSLLVFYAKDATGYRGIVWNFRRVLSGRMIPLDLLPVAVMDVLLLLPFASGFFLPIQFMMGRIEIEELLGGLWVIVPWILGIWLLSHLLWNRAVRHFEGVGI